MSSKQILSKNVKYYRFQLQYSQERLAELSGLSSRYISNIENGKSNVSLDKIDNLANALKVEVYQLFQKQDTKDLQKRVNMK